MTKTPVIFTLYVDDENNAETFWGELEAAFPGIANNLREFGDTDVLSSEWEAIKQLPGFTDGPAHAPTALIAEVREYSVE